MNSRATGKNDLTAKIRNMPNQWFIFIKHWLYRGQKPNAIAKIINRRQAQAASKITTINGLVALDVIGRKSGRLISFPLVMVTVDGQRYFVSMLGENVQWIHNVRASGGRAVLCSRSREDVLLEEVPIALRAPIIKAYLQIADGARPHILVDKDADLAEFDKIAQHHPVFRIHNLE